MFREEVGKLDLTFTSWSELALGQKFDHKHFALFNFYLKCAIAFYCFLLPYIRFFSNL